MNPSLGVALSNAWARMVRILFRPFRIDYWFTIGFAAFLSELGSHGGSGGGGGRNTEELDRRVFEPVMEFLTNPAMIAIIIVAAVCLFVLGIVLLWLSCRGRFVYLDCVVRERAAIVEPWKRTARLGNSLFLWSLCFMLLVILAVMAATLPFVPRFMHFPHNRFPSAEQLSGFGLWFLLIVPIVIVALYVHVWLNHFVVPVMYRYGIPTMQAWNRFMPLLRERAGSFLLYGVVMFLLWLAMTFAYVLVGFLTCCVGFIILIVPYIGTIAMLPPLTLFRGLGPEYLRQFGPEWSVFDAAPSASAPAPQGTAS